MIRRTLERIAKTGGHEKDGNEQVNLDPGQPKQTVKNIGGNTLARFICIGIIYPAALSSKQKMKV
jgi:hypothetical protein